MRMIIITVIKNDIFVNIFYPPPINIPAARTKDPPKTTWNMALVNFIFMYLVCIQAIAHNSTNTNIIANNSSSIKISY